MNKINKVSRATFLTIWSWRNTPPSTHPWGLSAKLNFSQDNQRPSWNSYLGTCFLPKFSQFQIKFLCQPLLPGWCSCLSRWRGQSECLRKVTSTSFWVICCRVLHILFLGINITQLNLCWQKHVSLSLSLVSMRLYKEMFFSERPSPFPPLLPQKLTTVFAGTWHCWKMPWE